MPSPFPGMNPSLERETVWSDFHTEYCKAIKKALVPQLQPEFYVKFNEHVYVRLTETLEERVEVRKRKLHKTDDGVRTDSEPDAARKSPAPIAVVLALAAVYLVWGSAYLAMRFAVETLPPFLMAGSRYALAGLIAYGCWHGAARPDRA